MRIALFGILLLFFSSSCFSQNVSYSFFYDSLYGRLSKDYSLSQKVFWNSRKSIKYDPKELMIFANLSLENKDETSFKRLLKILCGKYGFRDIESSESNGFKRYIPNLFDKENVPILEWAKKKSKRISIKWLRKNPHSTSMQIELSKIKFKDQFARKISFSIFPLIESSTEDSITINSVINEYGKILDDIDFQNVIQLENIILTNQGKLPTNFNSGFLCTGIIGLILSHNFKRKANLKKTWGKIFPYIEEAFLRGEISNSFFYDYDYFLNLHFGYQYYGYLGPSVPLIDELNYPLRKEKFLHDFNNIK